ncbi:MAG: iron(III) transport system ATP-binding protein [Myxococcota bacterium]|jgi:iron(III) transport system ATP-binding protein
MSEPLSIVALRHRYGKTPVLDGIDLSVAAGEFVAILGASGCGKTTLLRAVAGLVTPTDGEIHINGAVVTSGGRERVPVERRGVGLVFQDYALFPHMSVTDNVGFGLPRGERAARVSALLALAGLESLADRRPAALSGGQQQRVALVRALAPRPHLLLLDEPFANVDAERRRDLGGQLRAAVRAEGTAALLVTHDRADALRLADRVVAVVPAPAGAVIAQAGPPEVLYRRPATEAVARLTGPAFFLDATARGTVADTALGPTDLLVPRQGPVRLLLRPEQLRLQPGERDQIVERDFLGRGWSLRIDTPAGRLSVEVARLPTAATAEVVLDGPLWALPG